MEEEDHITRFGFRDRDLVSLQPVADRSTFYRMGACTNDLFLHLLVKCREIPPHVREGSLRIRGVQLDDGEKLVSGNADHYLFVREDG